MVESGLPRAGSSGGPRRSRSSRRSSHRVRRSEPAATHGERTMARTRSTPYHAQLDRYLSDHAGERATFSAATLEGQFDHPTRQELHTSLGGIHKALMTAFSVGKVIAYHDDAGHPL